MRITVKLFASLARFLPPGGKDNEAAVDVPDGDAVGAVMDRLNLPPGSCHLVLVNGTYTPPGERARWPLKDGDTLAVWPPVAGG